jgi:hypothetical protein
LWKPEDGRNFTLDIRRGGHGNRWFYDSAGLIKLLAIWQNIWIAPLYSMPAAEKFNRLLGIAPR